MAALKAKRRSNGGAPLQRMRCGKQLHTSRNRKNVISWRINQSKLNNFLCAIRFTNLPRVNPCSGFCHKPCAAHLSYCKLILAFRYVRLCVQCVVPNLLGFDVVRICIKTPRPQTSPHQIICVFSIFPWCVHIFGIPARTSARPKPVVRPQHRALVTRKDKMKCWTGCLLFMFRPKKQQGENGTHTLLHLANPSRHDWSRGQCKQFWNAKNKRTPKQAHTQVRRQMHKRRGNATQLTLDV